MKAKLHALRVARHPDRHGHVHVSGVLDVEGHHLPFEHKLHARHDAGELERRLEEHHAKGALWAKMRPSYHWVGRESRTVRESLTVEINVTFSDIGAFGPHDWRLRVFWEETIGGVSEARKRVFRADSPAGIPPIEKVKEIVYADVQARAEAHQAASPHLQAAREMRRAMHERKAKG